MSMSIMHTLVRMTGVATSCHILAIMVLMSRMSIRWSMSFASMTNIIILWRLFKLAPSLIIAIIINIVSLATVHLIVFHMTLNIAIIIILIIFVF